MKSFLTYGKKSSRVVVEDNFDDHFNSPPPLESNENDSKRPSLVKTKSEIDLRNRRYGSFEDESRSMRSPKAKLSSRLSLSAWSLTKDNDHENENDPSENGDDHENEKEKPRFGSLRFKKFSFSMENLTDPFSTPSPKPRKPSLLNRVSRGFTSSPSTPDQYEPTNITRTSNLFASQESLSSLLTTSPRTSESGYSCIKNRRIKYGEGVRVEYPEEENEEEPTSPQSPQKRKPKKVKEKTVKRPESEPLSDEEKEKEKEESSDKKLDVEKEKSKLKVKKVKKTREGGHKKHVLENGEHDKDPEHHNDEEKKNQKETETQIETTGNEKIDNVHKEKEKEKETKRKEKHSKTTQSETKLFTEKEIEKIIGSIDHDQTQNRTSMHEMFDSLTLDKQSKRQSVSEKLKLDEKNNPELHQCDSSDSLEQAVKESVAHEIKRSTEEREQIRNQQVIQWMDSLVGKYETSSRVESKEVDDAFRISPDSKVTKSISSKSISSLHNERKVDVTLEDVMSACEQETRTSIAVFIGTESLKTMKKLGESTFAEVFDGSFRTKDCAIKIIPFGGKALVNGFPQMHPDDIYQEIQITKHLSSIGKLYIGSPHTNFVKSHCIQICQGVYPKTLLKEWDIWTLKKQSENTRPDFFQRDQLYAVLVLENSGIDLEHTTLRNLLQAKSLLLQICLSLISAEKLYKFEHRDLHWGNILTTPTANDKLQYLFEDRFFWIETHGVVATIIDYTISRMEYEGELFYVDLEKDEDYFTGEGDYQFDVYRMMREENHGEWNKFHPKNNLFWIHYLVDKFIQGVKYSGRKKTKAQLAPFREFKDRILQCNSISEIIRDQFFSEVIADEVVLNPLARLKM